MSDNNVKNNVYVFIRGFSVVAYFLALSILFGILIVCRRTTFEIDMLTRDPIAVFNGSPFIGFLSNIGILIWTFTTAITFFSSLLIIVVNKNNYGTFFLLGAGILTSILLLDDLFMIHEYIAPYYLNIPEQIVFLIYSILALLFFISFRNTILETNYFLLIIAMCFFGSSILSDWFIENKGYYFLLEDGLKFLGIVTWFLYFFNVSLRSCLKTVQHYSYGR